MLLKRTQDGWSVPSTKNYTSEKQLKLMLADSPDIVPGAEGSATVTEFPVPLGGAVDLVCVAADGTITLVECKLVANPDIRRTVVGQLFAYASGLRGMTVDEITPELRRIVEYLHAHLSAEVPIVALELGYLKAEADDEFLVSQSYGAELAAEKQAAKPTVVGKHAPRRWTNDELTVAISGIVKPAEKQFVTALWQHSVEHNATVLGGVGANTSAGFYYPVAGKRSSLWSLWISDDSAMVALNIGSVANASYAAAQELLAQARHHPLLNDGLPAVDAQAMGKYPKYPAASLAEDPGIEGFIKLLDMVLNFADVNPPMEPVS